MITLEEYKEYLISVYRYEIDNTEENINKRKNNLKRKYDDDFLRKIIIDTYSFVRDVLSSKTIKNGYCSFDLEKDTTSYIDLNLVGGYNSDTIFSDANGKLISKYILSKVFGDYFIIDVKEELIDYETEDEDIFGIDVNYSLYMQGFPKDIEKLQEKYLEKKLV